jgi:hypothetical protein
MQKLLFLLSALMIISCNTQDQKAAQAAAPAIPSGTSANSATFNQSFKPALYAYFNLKDQFIAENIASIDSAAARMILSVDQIRIDSLRGDSSVALIARSFTGGITAELKGLLGEKELEAKRTSFQMIGEQFYDLIRSVQYDEEVIYHQFCPMAFNNEGAFWLSNSSEIRNPYLPKTMPGCGEVRDSIDLRIKIK